MRSAGAGYIYPRFFDKSSRQDCPYVILPGFLCLLFREKGLKMAETAATGGGLKAFQTKAQNLGARLNNMALPNLSAFMGWGVLTVLAV